MKVIAILAIGTMMAVGVPFGASANTLQLQAPTTCSASTQKAVARLKRLLVACERRVLCRVPLEIAIQVALKSCGIP
ncbi:MAG: hypothetical protein C0465_17860 [Ralstonia sp.]|uniref:hypothetical protein n=1 Tax=Ralstonia sp. TaxID=54061 RepID=UPI00257E26F7|nr:hypothetical protein [Ralstonia sp.]MBA4232467.1 hypothetical protein [Ralstonia sp.]